VNQEFNAWFQPEELLPKALSVPAVVRHLEKKIYLMFGLTLESVMPPYYNPRDHKFPADIYLEEATSTGAGFTAPIDRSRHQGVAPFETV
jgi:hypothetical protein